MWRWRSYEGRAWRVAALVAAVVAAMWRVPCDVTTHAHFPTLPPHTLAHMLADFAYQPHVVTWRVTSDASNYTTWRYTVAYECGPRCRGGAKVTAHDQRRLEHGSVADFHTVRVQRRDCFAVPLLPWPSFCEEVESEAMVAGQASGGAKLQEIARVHCASLSVLSGACAVRLRDLRNSYVRALRNAAAAAAAILA